MATSHIPGLDFEKPIIELERKIDELKGFTTREDINMSDEVWVFGDEISEGMALEIEYAKKENIPLVYVDGGDDD